MTVERKSRPVGNGAALSKSTTTDGSSVLQPADDLRSAGDRYGNTSRQVSWWTVHELVQPHIDLTDGFPVVGTVAWQLLSDTDPAKWAAVLDAAQHHALRLDMRQEASIQAAQAISVSQDWSAIAQGNLVRRAFYEARPWLRRQKVA